MLATKSVEQETEELKTIIGGSIKRSVALGGRPIVVKPIRGASWGVMLFPEHNMWSITKRKDGKQTAYQKCTRDKVIQAFKALESSDSIQLAVERITKIGGQHGSRNQSTKQPNI
jgi:hypothetical protein